LARSYKNTSVHVPFFDKLKARNIEEEEFKLVIVKLYVIENTTGEPNKKKI
jgi:hypothetical protein